MIVVASTKVGAVQVSFLEIAPALLYSKRGVSSVLPSVRVPFAFFALMANVCVATLVRVRCRTTALGRTMSTAAYTLGLAAQTPCLDDL
mgnify:CR=1 FL=1